MPKKKETQDFVSQIAWTEGLPEGGGSWGELVRNSVLEVSEETEMLRKKIDGLQQQIADAKETIKQREKHLARVCARAQEDAVLRYSAEEVAKATAEAGGAEKAD